MNFSSLLILYMFFWYISLPLLFHVNIHHLLFLFFIHIYPILVYDILSRFLQGRLSFISTPPSVGWLAGGVGWLKRTGKAQCPGFLMGGSMIGPPSRIRLIFASNV